MNNFYNRTAALAARTKARSEDVRDELDAVSAGFDLLPTPDGAGTGFTDPVIVGVPTLDAHSATKAYVDASFGTNAANLAAALAAQTAAEAAQTAAELAETNAQTSETNASTSASNASTSETNAAASAATAEGWATNANVVTVATNIGDINTTATNIASINTAAANIASINNFGDTYFVSATEPLTPTEGDLWFDTVTDIMKVYNGGSWQNAGSSVNGTSERYSYTATGGQTVFAATYDSGFVDVYLNGVKLIDGTDFTATNGTDITLSAGATAGDSVEIVGYGTFEVADVYTQAQSTALFVAQTDIGVTVQAYDANTTKNNTTNTFTANQTVSAELKANSYNESYEAVTSTTNATTVNCENANTFMHTLTENTTFTFSNPPAAGTAYTMTVEVIQDAGATGYTVTWPASVDWPSATAPTLTATASAVDVFVFTTRDGGTTWYGYVAGQAFG